MSTYGGIRVLPGPPRPEVRRRGTWDLLAQGVAGEPAERVGDEISRGALGDPAAADGSVRPETRARSRSQPLAGDLAAHEARVRLHVLVDGLVELVEPRARRGVFVDAAVQLQAFDVRGRHRAAFDLERDAREGDPVVDAVRGHDRRVALGPVRLPPHLELSLFDLVHLRHDDVDLVELVDEPRERVRLRSPWARRAALGRERLAVSERHAVHHEHDDVDLERSQLRERLDERAPQRQHARAVVGRPPEHVAVEEAQDRESPVRRVDHRVRVDASFEVPGATSDDVTRKRRRLRRATDLRSRSGSSPRDSPGPGPRRARRRREPRATCRPSGRRAAPPRRPR